MAAGDSLTRLEQHHRQMADYHDQFAERARIGSWGEKRAAKALLALARYGWRLLEDRRWQVGSMANIDLILVGPGGVIVIDVKTWAKVPTVDRDGCLTSHDDERLRLLDATRAVAESLALFKLAPAAVTAMMMFAGRGLNRRAKGVRLVSVENAAGVLAGYRRRLSDVEIDLLYDHVAQAFPAHLFDGNDVADVPVVDRGATDAAWARNVEAGPIEHWMSFLADDQLSLVGRHWNGPARISGPAGTGKSVVGLHRAEYLVRHGHKRVLYVTYARQLPAVARNLMRQMAPDVVDNIRFQTVDSWAMRLLRSRGVKFTVDRTRAKTLFNLSWVRMRAELDSRIDYWRDEVAYVIKGLRLRSLDEYLTTERKGRETGLRDEKRRAVWQLYLDYQARLQREGIIDFADVMTLALDSVLKKPVNDIDSVIVDEAQDLSLVSVRLMHAVVGDRPNGLLLISDSQQIVYPVGFPLIDAGVDVRGRAVRLKTNYRNSAAIMDAARETLALVSTDDSDGLPDDMELTRLGSAVVHARHESSTALDIAFVHAVNAFVDHGGAAVLCQSTGECAHYMKLLRGVGLKVQDLDEYDGRPNDAVKVGRFRRVKGLDFKAVFIPRFDELLRVSQCKDDPDTAKLVARQLWVGMTRPRDFLWLGSVG